METSHIHRWLTALAALPLLGLIIFKGGAFLFTLLLILVSCVGFFEWNKITGGNKHSLTNARLVSYYLIPVVYILSYQNAPVFFLSIAGSFLVILFSGLKDFDETEEHYKGILYIFTGFFYSVILLSFLNMIRLGENGIAGVLLLVISAFASDTGAFYAGRKFGNKKLMPRVSPKKTVEGFLGGFCLSCIAALACKFLFFSSLPVLNALLCGLAAGISVPLGDLFESMTKRVFHVKDSGNILPGHGGILDRIDGLLFAAPLFYILINL